MREILFRGKRSYDGKWIFGNLVVDKSLDPHIVPHDFFFEDGHHLVYDDETDNPVFVFKDSVGQYTGLKDRNGKRIFEGDVLQFGDRCLMVWWNGEAFQWQAKSIRGYDVIPYEISNRGDWTNIDLGNIYAEVPITGDMTTEIIGNIYDNPELLEVEK